MLLSGAYAFLTLEYYIYNISQRPKYHFNGAAWAFPIWSLEIMPELASVVAIKIEDEVGAHPRMLRWKFRFRIKTDISSIFNWLANTMVGMEVDNYEVTSRYLQLVMCDDPLGVSFEPPRNPVKLGESCQRRRHVKESDSNPKLEDAEKESTESDERPRRNKDKRPLKGKRSRKDNSTSTSGSRGSDETDSFNWNEIRFMEKTADLTYKKVKKKIISEVLQLDR